MIGHVSIAVPDLGRSAAFYDRVLTPLGLKRIVSRGVAVGCGKSYPEFWLNARRDPYGNTVEAITFPRSDAI